jgi:hypothetical protein
MNTQQILEARRNDLEYKEEKTKGVLTKAITELSGSESATATKLARRFVNISKAVDVLKEKQKELNLQLTGVVENVFDDATDAVLTRVVNTASFSITLSKQEQAKEKVEVDYESIYKQLVALVSPELEDQVKAIIEANTKKWVPENKKPGLRVKGLDESMGGVLSGFIDKIKSFAKNLYSGIMDWTRSYDAKLNELAKQASIKKLTQESYIDMPKIVTVTTHLNISEHIGSIKINGIKIVSLEPAPNGLVEATLRGFETVIDDFMTTAHLTETSAGSDDKAKVVFDKLHDQIIEKVKTIRKIMDSDDYYAAIEIDDTLSQGKGRSIGTFYAEALTVLSKFESELDKMTHGFRTL